MTSWIFSEFYLGLAAAYKPCRVRLRQCCTSKLDVARTPPMSATTLLRCKVTVVLTAEPLPVLRTLNPHSPTVFVFIRPCYTFMDATVIVWFKSHECKSRSSLSYIFLQFDLFNRLLVKLYCFTVWASPSLYRLLISPFYFLWLWVSIWPVLGSASSISKLLFAHMYYNCDHLLAYIVKAPGHLLVGPSIKHISAL